MVLLVGLQIWKTFVSFGVVEEVAGTELQKLIGLLSAGNESHIRSFYVQNSAQMESHNGELSN